ncbi:MAG TPA: TspO/MBR family protein [Polyangiaceae bacterium LLY-WYZ-15_(1-7)]|nr:TspO/MBR family protein [Polyangiaceae bacterium LLY-WYZ-15_(1-7)]HJL05907.1 TspO/MBR family protein [Polyangiaceae bacterium LLY-WYZ-15_(1-7)]HJL08200.1 TspO/MBR family protein [Polyangiaceae bacterium LLY-WYZ-15_(1-7)]HJL21041.1 TspO/MBR family protein [Polyangiaceae bacterium LLY-WYZ-15_(1-7)]HJL28517.1 TspO/MBR family protein [Polyangiaceae bacterium LLY-WYZ-15_(1-7)]
MPPAASSSERPPDPGASVGARRLALYLLVFVGAALGLNGWIFSTGAIAWARTLENPSWSPPGPVIGTVWVLLFALMAGAAYLVDRRGLPARRTPARLAIFAQWALCMSWTWAYFGLRNVPNGFYVTVAAWLLCVVAIVLTARASRRAALLLAPLQGWLSFALALSWVTWQLNR